MDLASLSWADLLGTLVSFVFTLFIFSYIFGDNALFRLAIHTFIGVAAGYALAVAWHNVIWPQLLLPLFNGSPSERLVIAIPLALSGLLVTKVSPRLASLGTPVIALLVGIGAATAIGGAVMGTLFPQVGASINLFDLQAARESGASLWLQLGNGVIILFGTLATLMYFHFGARPQSDPSMSGEIAQRGALIDGLAFAGQAFIAITFGAMFAGVYAAALVALVERLNFIIQLLLPLVRS